MADLFFVLRRKVHRWRQLKWSERWLFLQALLLFPMLVFGLRLYGFQRMQMMLKKRMSKGFGPDSMFDNHNDDVLETCQNISNIINIAARYSLVFPKCLPKSLVLWWILGREGIVSDLRIGALKERDRFEAHAWVEYGGVVINDSQLVHERYAVFDSSISNIGKV